MLKQIPEDLFHKLTRFLIIGTILALFGVVCMLKEPGAIGEWDDISLVTVSILNDGNVTIDEQDVIMAKEWMPEWKEHLDYIHLSGYYTEHGDALSWYFPLYSAMCVPAFAILRGAGISGAYAFSVTNILLYLFALIYAYRHSDFSAKVNFGFITVLCVNPITLYTIWVSGEVFIFAFLLPALICWQKGKYNQAALFLSIASTLNPSVLVAGIVMIIEYLYLVICDTGLRQIWKRSKDILLLAGCYLPSLVPFAWNLYFVGHINMTAATETDMNVRNIAARFFSYLFDLNLGFLPYYGVMLVLFILAVCVAVRSHNRKILLFAIAFVGICLIYSLEVHINSGMSGLARYNAWSAIIIIMVFFMWRNTCEAKRLVRLLDTGLLCSITWTAVAILSIVLTNPIGYLEMTPIAKVVLEYAPHIYNPFPDVFNARVNHVDEIGYEHNLPIIYRDGDWQCRKILANYENKEYILEQVNCSEEHKLWLSEQLDALKSEGTKYISIGKDKIIYWED